MLQCRYRSASKRHLREQLLRVEKSVCCCASCSSKDVALLYIFQLPTGTPHRFSRPKHKLCGKCAPHYCSCGLERPLAVGGFTSRQLQHPAQSSMHVIAAVCLSVAALAAVAAVLALPNSYVQVPEGSAGVLFVGGAAQTMLSAGIHFVCESGSGEAISAVVHA